VNRELLLFRFKDRLFIFKIPFIRLFFWENKHLTILQNSFFNTFHSLMDESAPKISLSWISQHVHSFLSEKRILLMSGGTEFRFCLFWFFC